VTLVDPAPPGRRAEPGFDGRSYALALTSQRLLKALGVWGRWRKHSQPILEIKVTDGRAGRRAVALRAAFDHAEIEEGPMGHMIEDRFLRRALLEARSGLRSPDHAVRGETWSSQHGADEGSVSAQRAMAGPSAPG
jgi:2-octaprenyl-6-methoxyphenol hydroxylase